LTLSEAAFIARRSVRTLQRAYRRGVLEAYRDGNGRGISIEYADLRAWMKSSRTRPEGVKEKRADAQLQRPARQRSARLAENLRLLDQVTKRRR
jgi:excisionase family DNA binding protein